MDYKTLDANKNKGKVPRGFATLALLAGSIGALWLLWSIEDAARVARAQQPIEEPRAALPRRTADTIGLNGLRRTESDADAALKQEPLPPALDEAELKAIKAQLTGEFQDPLVLTLFGLKGESTYEHINYTADKLFDRGNKTDVAAMLRYLQTPLLINLNDMEWRAIQRHIVDYMAMEYADREHAEQSLLALLGREDIDTPVKTAVLNRMEKVYAASPRPENIEQTLWQLAEGSDHGLASESLKALTRVSYENQSIDQGKLSRVSAAIVSQQGAGVIARVIAMQVATWLENPAIFPEALQLIKRQDSPEMLKMAAIDTISRLGDASAVDELEALGESESAAVQRAARAAIEKLSGQVGN